MYVFGVSIWNHHWDGVQKPANLEMLCILYIHSLKDEMLLFKSIVLS